MFWIWLLLKHAHTGTVGPEDRYFTFVCEHCAATMAAMVRTAATGSGRTVEKAQLEAQRHADGFAYRAVNAAGCPSCSRLSPDAIAAYEATSNIASRQTKRRLPVTIGIALAFFVPLAIPAIMDVRHSMLLSLVAVSTSIGFAALAFGILSNPTSAPPNIPQGVWFSRDPAQGSSSWFPAQPGKDTPTLPPQPSSRRRHVAFITTVVCGLAAILAFTLWKGTFRHVYVASPEARGGVRSGELVVRIDGENVGNVSSMVSEADADIPFRTFTVRAGSHRVVVVDTSGREFTYTLDASSAAWVIAPHAREEGLCLARITWYYGRKPVDGDDHILNQEAPNDFAALPSAIDFVFVTPPSSIQTQSGSETRSSLRALDCNALEREHMVPFKDARRTDSDPPPDPSPPL